MKRRITALLLAGVMLVQGSLGLPVNAETVDLSEISAPDYEILTEEMSEIGSDGFSAAEDGISESGEATDIGGDTAIEQDVIVNEDIADAEPQNVQESGKSSPELTEGLSLDYVEDGFLNGIEVVEDPGIEADSGSEDLYSMGIAEQPASISNMEIVLYALDDSYREKISIPAELMQEYKLEEPKASFAVTEGKSVTVSSDGWIRPATEVMYWNGNVGSSWSTGAAGETKTINYIFERSVITVRTASQSYEVGVTVCDYASVYAENVMDDYIARNISDEMSGLEKLQVITAFPAQYDYSVLHSGYTGLIVFGGGDCWASTSAILYMCRKVGLQARSRNAANDPGAGSGHRNVSVSIDGKTYVADAGYDETAPRYYSVTEISAFSYEVNEDGATATISRYEGADRNVVIPAELEGFEVTVVGYSAFDSIDGIESVTIPEGVTKIDIGAFAYCYDLKKVSLPSTLKIIAESAFEGSGLEGIEIPSGTEEIGERAFCGNVSYGGEPSRKSLKSVTFMGNQLKTIGDYAFSTCGLTSVSIPASVVSIGEDVFSFNSDLEEINVASDNPNYASVGGVLFDKGLTRLVIYPAAKSADTYNIPDGVSVIGTHAFEDVRLLKKAVLPGSVRKVEHGAFGWSESLEEIWFLGDAPDIDEAAFSTFSSGEGYYYHKVYYARDNSTWKKEFMAGLEGNLDWTPYTECDLSGTHEFGEYVVTEKPTVFKKGYKVRTCTICGKEEEASVDKLKPAIKLNTSSVTLQIYQVSSVLKVSGLMEGDYVECWESEDEDIVFAGYDGTLRTFGKVGETKVTVTLGSGLHASVKVKVQKGEVITQKISITKKKYIVEKGKKLILLPVITPISTQDETTYRSSNTKVAVVDSKGVVTAKEAGTAKITIQSGSKSVTVTVRVLKVKVKKIKGVPAKKTIKKGETYTFKVRLLPKGSSGKITYKSSNKKVAVVNAKGKLTARKKGKAVITVKAGKIKMKCKVTVK